MQKNILVSIFLGAVWIFLPSCSSNTDNNTELQAPETENSEMANDNDDPGKNEGKTNTTTLTAATDASATNIKNLVAAYTGETTASAKYAAFSKKAQEEGFTQIALLFKATSTSENIHANNHRAVLEEMGETIPVIKPEFTVKTTLENLADAISGESYEITTMYPDFIATANSADNEIAGTSLKYAYRTEQKHKLLYEKALTALQTNQVNTLSSEYVVCPTCGNTYDSKPPKRCRISMTKGERFIKIEA